MNPKYIYQLDDGYWYRVGTQAEFERWGSLHLDIAVLVRLGSYEQPRMYLMGRRERDPKVMAIRPASQVTEVLL